MIEDLNKKLSDELNIPIKTEAQVVYILSCIRKVIELGGKSKKKKYRKLKFYCDWALHTQIDDLDVFEEEVAKFNQGDFHAGNRILSFEHLSNELTQFLVEYKLPTSLYDSWENMKNFHEKLANIYKDVPLIVKTIRKIRVRITNVEKNENVVIGFKVELLQK